MWAWDSGSDSDSDSDSDSSKSEQSVPSAFDTSRTNADSVNCSGSNKALKAMSRKCATKLRHGLSAVFTSKSNQSVTDPKSSGKEVRPALIGYCKCRLIGTATQKIHIGTPGWALYTPCRVCPGTVPIYSPGERT
jgi:hypothetical protein